MQFPGSSLWSNEHTKKTVYHRQSIIVKTMYRQRLNSHQNWQFHHHSQNWYSVRFIQSNIFACASSTLLYSAGVCARQDVPMHIQEDHRDRLQCTTIAPRTKFYRVEYSLNTQNFIHTLISAKTAMEYFLLHAFSKDTWKLQHVSEWWPQPSVNSHVSRLEWKFAKPFFSTEMTELSMQMPVMLSCLQLHVHMC